MQAMIDLPDGLYRRAESAATIRGVALGDLVASLPEKGLPALEEMKDGHDEPIPVVIPGAGRPYR